MGVKAVKNQITRNKNQIARNKNQIARNKNQIARKQDPNNKQEPNKIQIRKFKIVLSWGLMHMNATLFIFNLFGT